MTVIILESLLKNIDSILELLAYELSDSLLFKFMDK